MRRQPLAGTTSGAPLLPWVSGGAVGGNELRGVFSQDIVSVMTTTTKQDLLNQLPARWRATYGSGRYGADKALILSALEAEPNLTEARATAIIGNGSWTMNCCNECEQDCEITVRLGQEPDYESATASICLPCLQKAVTLASTMPAPAAPVTV
jgi:hypothetical protein